jgi:hypothetical protein
MTEVSITDITHFFHIHNVMGLVLLFVMFMRYGCGKIALCIGGEANAMVLLCSCVMA